MKVTTEWLSDFISFDTPVPELVERLTMAGLEVESCEPAVPALEGVVSARIVKVSPHPSADRLQVCDVDAGLKGQHRVVCGAPNARQDLISCLALPGATIAGGKQVAHSAIRGIESAGMLCSAAELGLGDDASGILELDPMTALGLDFTASVANDTVIEVNITPNRGDCLSVMGLARELSAILDVPMTCAPIAPVAAVTASTFPVALKSANKCSRYVGRVVDEVNASVPTPFWLKERLRRCGVRSINVVVDITNYTMLALGQPMHAFDLVQLTGGIEVRDGRSGERLTVLDGSDLTLEDCLVIADRRGPVAIAGVMGGQASGVKISTTRVFLESAYFDQACVAGTARRFNLHTDAAQRFERGVDPQGQAHAIEFATRLMVEHCGGRPGPAIDVSAPTNLSVRPPISFRPRRVTDVLGMAVASETVQRIFERLNLQVTTAADRWQVIPPTYRFDLGREVDLIEEVARIHGFDALPVARPSGQTALGPHSARRNVVDALRGYLVADGYFEAITYSFIAPELAEIFSTSERPLLALTNPISRDMAVMRGSLWPGLLKAAQYNLNRQADTTRLFEIGMVFGQQGQKVSQIVKIAGLATGEVDPQQWGLLTRELDFFDMKQSIVNMLAAGGVRGARFEPATMVGLHPGQTAAIIVGNIPVGFLGTLHPSVRNSLELEGNLVLFEISVEDLPSAKRASFVPLYRYPHVRRDLSILVPEGVSAEAVLMTARAAGEGLLKDLQLFDVYRGQGIDSDKKSLALGLIFQDSSSTLTDDQVEAAVQNILARLSRDLGGTLRA